MKYRIVSHTDREGVQYYTVQWKGWFFWHTVQKCNWAGGSPDVFYHLQAAENRLALEIAGYPSKVLKEVQA